MGTGLLESLKKHRLENFITEAFAWILKNHSDFSKYFVDAANITTLEKSIGINQDLNIKQCLALLKKASEISQGEVASLKIVSIIQNSKFVADDLIYGFTKWTKP